MSEWVNYKHLRTTVNFADVFDHYHIQLKVRGDQAQGYCPLPSHEGRGRSPSFSANLARGIWQCFGCKAKGNVIEFIAYMEGLNPQDRKEFHRAALLARDRFLKGDSPKRSTKAPKERPPVKAQTTKTVVINAPLDFQLKDLDPEHPYLIKRGFTGDTMEHFGVGYCKRGLMKGRIAIPLHNNNGELIGYAGRIVDDDRISNNCPRYIFPGAREHRGVAHQFRKSLVLYNGHAIGATVKRLVVVEGFASVWWLWQHGFQDAVALMGSTCSAEQAQIIVAHVDPSGYVCVFTDGDRSGRDCAWSAIQQVATQRMVRLVPIDDGQQPTDLSGEKLSAVIP